MGLPSSSLKTSPDSEQELVNGALIDVLVDSGVQNGIAFFVPQNLPGQ